MRRSTLLFSAEHLPTPRFAEFLKDIRIPGGNLREIDDSLQKRFFQKSPDGQPLERWELKEVEVSCPIERLRQHLASGGFMDKTIPVYKNYNYAVWPGGLVIRAAARLGDLTNAWNSGVRWKQTIVLGGKRPLQPDKESLEQCCKALSIARDGDHLAGWLWRHFNPQTELDMMRWVWENFNYPNRNKGDLFSYPVAFVDAPMKPPVKEGGQPTRPTTEDTVAEWLKSNPKPGSALLSSGAPYGMAQDEALWTLLEPHGFIVETFGHAAPDLPIENLMREVAGCVNRIRRSRGL